MENLEKSNDESKSVLLFCVHRLLIVIIIGIAASLLLIFIFEPNVEKQKEASLDLKIIVIAQKAKYYKEGIFANSIQELNLDFQPTFKNFEYSFLLPKQKTIIDGVFIVAKTKNINERNFLGLVYAYTKNSIYTQICGAKRPGIVAPEVITLPSIEKDISPLSSISRCPQNYTPIPR